MNKLRTKFLTKSDNYILTTLLMSRHLDLTHLFCRTCTYSRKNTATKLVGGKCRLNEHLNGQQTGSIEECFLKNKRI